MQYLRKNNLGDWGKMERILKDGEDVRPADLHKANKILDVSLPVKLKLTPIYKADFLGNLSTISGDVLLHPTNTKEMYQTISTTPGQNIKRSSYPIMNFLTPQTTNQKTVLNF